MNPRTFLNNYSIPDFWKLGNSDNSEKFVNSKKKQKINKFRKLSEQFCKFRKLLETLKLLQKSEHLVIPETFWTIVKSRFLNNLGIPKISETYDIPNISEQLRNSWKSPRVK